MKLFNNRLNNTLNKSVLEDKGALQMDFGANKTPVETIKEGAFGGTYLRDIYSSVNGEWYKKSWKEFDQLKNIDHKFYCSDYYRSVNNMVLNAEHQYDFGKVKDELMK